MHGGHLSEVLQVRINHLFEKLPKEVESEKFQKNFNKFFPRPNKVSTFFQRNEITN